MPIVIPDNLPAFSVMEKEGVQVMSEKKALRQDIRALEIGLINLMPNKVDTETQFIRLIGSTPLQINFTLIRMTEHVSKSTSMEYLNQFYVTYEEIKDRKFDGLIITGAPIEHLEYEEIYYWQELCDVFDWTQSNVHSTFGICWGGMAMMYYWYNLPKVQFDQKLFGCYPQTNHETNSPFLRGFSDNIYIPVSRWAGMDQKDIDESKGLKTLLGSQETGPCLIEDIRHHSLYIMNHFEYSTDTLMNEYNRDLNAEGIEIQLPKYYFPNENPEIKPINKWRSNGHLLYSNWINYIYQTTEYELAKIASERKTGIKT